MVRLQWVKSYKTRMVTAYVPILPLETAVKIQSRLKANFLQRSRGQAPLTNGQWSRAEVPWFSWWWLVMDCLQTDFLMSLAQQLQHAYTTFKMLLRIVDRVQSRIWGDCMPLGMSQVWERGQKYTVLGLRNNSRYKNLGCSHSSQIFLWSGG